MWMLNIKVNILLICIFDWTVLYLSDLYYMKMVVEMIIVVWVLGHKSQIICEPFFELCIK